LLAAQSQYEMSTTPFTAGTHLTGTMPGEELHLAAEPLYPSLQRTWNSRRVMSLTGRGDERQAPGPTKEIIRGSPLPIRARDEDSSAVFDEPLPGSVRKFTMDQFQRQFGPCHTYTAPASPLRRRLSVDTTETIPPSSMNPQRFQPTFAAAAAAATAVPGTIGAGGWRPVTGRFSLGSSSPSGRFGNTSTFPPARKPLAALENVPTERIHAVKFSESFDKTG